MVRHCIASLAGFGRRAERSACHCAVVARYSRPPLRVAALRCSSREIVDGARLSWRAISRTPCCCARQIAISSRSANDRERPDSGFADGARWDGGMPPALRNQRAPTAGDTPAPTAASSLEHPAAINTQNRWRSSRRATEGRPGEGNAPRPDRSERRFRTVIATSSLKVLRRPLEPGQFAFIAAKVKTALAAGEPAISVDAKKKELVGDFKNGGRAWRPKGSPEAVRVHDFLIKELGRAVPYGVYDLAANAGWVGVGQDHDTAAFAGQTIRRWWQEIGQPRYPGAKSLTITADGGGSNGVRVRLWKRELQRLADESGLAITVHHLPPGTSKGNAIEHRLFAFISPNWRAMPLVSYRVIVDLIGATTTRTGLSVRCELDPNRYPKGVTVSDAEMAGLNLARDEFHGEWSYTLSPRLPDQALVP